MLMDDDHGRRVARYHGIETVSTLGILLEFLLSSRLTREDYVGNVKRFSSQAWVGPEVTEEFLRRADMVD